MTCSTESLEILEEANRAALDALAEDPVAIDVTDHLPFVDAFLIVTANNPRHLKSVVNQISDTLRDTRKLHVSNIEGDTESGWILMDFGGVAVHVMLPDGREFYSLEKLWAHSPRIPLETAA